ncbi:MAG: carboxypeptidase regulatory-like domain-containing protein [Gemmataceae bacterium]
MTGKRWWRTAAGAAVLGLLAPLGCGGGSSSAPAGAGKAGGHAVSPPADTTPKPAATAPTAAAAPTPAPTTPPDIKPTAGAGTLVGRVSYNGEPPKRKPINFGAEKKCHEHHETPPTDDSLVVGSDRSVQWVLVRVAGKVPGSYPPGPPVVLDQKGCVFTPHVVAVQEGQEVDIRNSDPVLHNVRCEAVVNPAFNRNLPKPGDSMKVKFDAAEVGMKLKCDVHFWMGGVIHVIPHPFFAVTGADGRFTIPKLPPGTYKLEAWHEKLGKQSKEITVKEGGVQTADFTFEAK